MDKKQLIIVICGPTASGKTALSVRLAKEFDGEIISADSMQIYKGMDIATAKPSLAEREGIPHYLMDFLDPREGFSVADYVKLSHEIIGDIAARGKLPFVVGGTGLYISSLTENIDFFDTESDYRYREQLRSLAAEKGNEYLLEMLKDIDAKTAERLHPNNQNRIIRALEVYKTTGKTMSQLQAESRLKPTPYDTVSIALDYDRELLYERINKRVDNMVEAGLVEEAREFFTHNDYPTAAQAIGYKELFPYFKGEKPLDECIGHLKQETRRYAKRQMTWFRRDKSINQIKITRDTPPDFALNEARNIISQKILQTDT